MFATNRRGNEEIFRSTPDGKDQVQITDNELYDAAPRVSPDGTKILFHRGFGEDRYSIFVMDLDGSNEVRITEGDWDDSYPGLVSGRRAGSRSTPTATASSTST